jgi:general secretion pathway protein D
MSVFCRRVLTASIALIFLLTGCNSQNSRSSGISVSAAGVLDDLHLSTAPPPAPLPAFSPRSIAVLTMPVMIKPSAPVLGGVGARPVREPGTISLNFEKASLRSVIDAVLGDGLGLAYSVDERVDGVVTLISPQKLTKDEALEVLDGVLRLNGATLIKGDTLYRVVLSANARQNLPGPRIGAEQPGFGISVYVARHAAAASLQKLIEPLYQIAGALAVDSDHNLLLVTGSAEERRALIDAARLFDQDWLASQAVGIFPLHHAKPKQLAEELRSLFLPGGAAATGDPGSIRVSALDRLNAVMVVARQSSGLDAAAEWIERLDQTGAGERGLHVYAVHYAKVQNLAKLLSRLFASGASGVETGNAALPPGIAGTRVTTSSAPTGAAAPVGVGQAINGAASGSASGASSGMGAGGFGSGDHALAGDSESDTDQPNESGNGPRIIADAGSHNLVVMATAQEARMIEDALLQLDARPVQILIEATIVEVTLNKNLQYGVQYFLRGTKLLNQDSSVGFNAASTLGTISGIAPGFNGVLGSIANPSVILSALDQVTESKVLSSPQLLVTDSHEAMLKVGTQTPLLTQQAVSNITTNAPTVQGIEYHDTGVILRVLPRSNDTDTVSLDIAQEVSQVVANSANSLTPDIEERRIESSVTVQSGQTIMLGGLISENNSAAHAGLPGLSSIPGLAGLFGNVTDSRIRTELIIFITPHVLHDGTDAQRLTEELMGRLNSLRPPSP